MVGLRDEVLKPNNSLRSLGFSSLNPTKSDQKEDQNIIKVLAEEQLFLQIAKLYFLRIGTMLYLYRSEVFGQTRKTG